MLKNLVSGSWATRYQDVSLLLLRVVTGMVYVMHGYVLKVKIFTVAGFTGLLTSLSVPLPALFSYLVIGIEIVGGLALILGLWTRFAALSTTLISVFALLLVHLKGGFFVTTNGYEFVLLLVVAGLVLLTHGGGKHSLDARRSVGSQM